MAQSVNREYRVIRLDTDDKKHSVPGLKLRTFLRQAFTGLKAGASTEKNRAQRRAEARLYLLVEYATELTQPALAVAPLAQEGWNFQVVGVVVDVHASGDGVDGCRLVGVGSHPIVRGRAR